MTGFTTRLRTWLLIASASGLLSQSLFAGEVSSTFPSASHGQNLFGSSSGQDALGSSRAQPIGETQAPDL